MIDTVMELAMTFWQWVVFVVLVGIGFIFSKFDGQGEHRVGFEYSEMPHMKPLPIATKDKGFFKGIWHWLMGVRQWEICDDFHFKLSGVEYVIPKGFQFDGASVPKFLAMWLSPTGVLLMGGLVHDYVYKYACLMTKAGNNTEKMSQSQADKLFRDICIEVNGFKFLNYLAYWALAAAGFVAWNGHKKRGTHI
jgi:hypothetical protein